MLLHIVLLLRVLQVLLLRVLEAGGGLLLVAVVEGVGRDDGGLAGVARVGAHVARVGGLDVSLLAARGVPGWSNKSKIKRIMEKSERTVVSFAGLDL